MANQNKQKNYNSRNEINLKSALNMTPTAWLVSLLHRQKLIYYL